MIAEKTYWNRNGRHQVEYNRLFDLLVPFGGASTLLHGELLIAASKVYHDHYNNGGGNLRDGTLSQFVRTVWKFRGLFPEAVVGDLKKVLRGRASHQEVEDFMDAVVVMVRDFVG